MLGQENGKSISQKEKKKHSRWERRKPLGMFCIIDIMTIPLFAEG